mmetsp:Transcript_69563/g.190928  ORF Transcript_69563/g.190928 Transcript_69563/m.190928 type:complete len:116 (-) Transcript_69563:2-349(-)
MRRSGTGTRDEGADLFRRLSGARLVAIGLSWLAVALLSSRSSPGLTTRCMLVLHSTVCTMLERCISVLHVRTIVASRAEALHGASGTVHRATWVTQVVSWSRISAFARCQRILIT